MRREGESDHHHNHQHYHDVTLPLLQVQFGDNYLMVLSLSPYVVTFLIFCRPLILASSTLLI